MADGSATATGDRIMNTDPSKGPLSAGIEAAGFSDTNPPGQGSCAAGDPTKGGGSPSGTPTVPSIPTLVPPPLPVLPRAPLPPPMPQPRPPSALTPSPLPLPPTPPVMPVAPAPTPVNAAGTPPATPTATVYEPPLPPGGHTINGVKVVIKPDGVNAHQPSRGYTRYESAPYSFKYTTDGAGKIASFTPPPPLSVVIQTTYWPGTHPNIQSAYGRGTTPDDVKTRHTSLGFHESQHRGAAVDFIRNHAPPQFQGQVGQTAAQFNQAMTDYNNAVSKYMQDLDHFSDDSVDNAPGSNPPLSSYHGGAR